MRIMKTSNKYLFAIAIPLLTIILTCTFIFSHKTSMNSAPQEFVLFTMPKTGTHLLRPLLEKLTEKSSVSYWSQEIYLPKTYLYDKNMTDLFLMLPNVVQA